MNKNLNTSSRLKFGKVTKMFPSRNKKPRPRRSFRHLPEGFQFLLDGNPHPLAIPCIVAEVASSLPISDLKSFRQVCSQWNEEACKQFRQRGKIVLHGEENLIAYTKLQANSTTFHANFELSGDLELGSPSVQKFFELFGSKMKYICFNRVKWRESELKDLLFEKLPNLEELGFEVRPSSDARLFPNGNDSSSLDALNNNNVLVLPNANINNLQDPPAAVMISPPNCTLASEPTPLILPNIRVLRLNICSMMLEGTTPLLQDVLRASPNVEVISSLKSSTICNPLPMTFVQYICQAANYDTADDLVHMPSAADIAIAEAIIETKGLKLSKLACLDCSMRLRAVRLNQFALKGFPLRQLDLTVMSDVTSYSLQKLLKSVHESLAVLKLRFQPGCSAAEEFVSPELPKLNSLTLNGFKSSLKFLEQCPSLKELTFIRINLQKTLAMEAVQCDRTLQIESFQVFEEFSTEGLAGVSVRLLAVLMPKLKRLKLENLSDESLVEVFSEFKMLEELNALNGFYTDSGVTGIKKDVFASSQCPLDATAEIEMFSDVPNITRLKNIQSLALGSPKITDNSILHGVSLCKNIRRLHLLSYQISDISLLRLINTLDLVHLKTEFCFQISSNVVNQVKNKMKGRFVSLNEYSGPLKQSEIPKFMRRNGKAAVRLNKLDVKCLLSLSTSAPSSPAIKEEDESVEVEPVPIQPNNETNEVGKIKTLFEPLNERKV